MANEFIIKKGLISKANSVVSGSLIVTEGASGSFSGSFEGDGSGLTNIPAGISSSYALTASYVETAQTASYVLNAISSSYSTFAVSASYAVSASHEIIKEVSSSHADTASFAQSGNGIFSGIFSGSFEGDGNGLTGVISSSYAITASYALTALSASYAPGGGGGDTFPFTGDAVITGSLLVSGSGVSGSFSGSFVGDGSGLTGIIHTSASYALTASYVETAQTASYVLNAVSSSYSSTASYVTTAQTASYIISSSIDGITNYVRNDQTSSMTVLSSSFASTASYVETSQTASYVLNAVSSSYSLFAVSASYAVSASHEIIKEVSSSHADTASFAQSGDGIFSGSFSGSFEGGGSGLTDVPVTITNTLWVSATGNDTTAIKGNLQRPWASVSASVAVAVSGDSVIMEPGTYIESPFTLTAGVTLKTLGGLKSTTISASNNSATFITQKENSRLEGFTLVCPSGPFPGISYDNIG